MAGGVDFFQDQATLRARLRFCSDETNPTLAFEKIGRKILGNALFSGLFRSSARFRMAKSPEKPPFSIVSADTVGPSPPRPLGAHGRQLWDRVQSEYRITDCGGVELLSQACAAEDTAESLAEAIARDGHVIHSRTGVPRTHPAIKDELACRAFVVRTLERLGISIEAVKPPGRPPSGGLGWSPR